MNKIIFYVLCLLFFFIHTASTQEIDLSGLFKKYPSLVSNFSSALSKDNEAIKIKWLKSDLLEKFYFNQTSCKENKLSINSTSIEYLDQDLSNKEYADLANRITKTPMSVYKWEIEIETSGNYFLTKGFDTELEGYLNNNPVQVLNNGVITKYDSGKLWVNLNKGINTLFLFASHKTNSQILVVSESKFEIVKNEILKRINSKEDQEWVVTQFLPTLASLRNGCYPYIISILSTLNKRTPFLENEDSQAKFAKIVQSCKSEYEGYQIEKFIYEKYPNIYFQLNKKGDSFSGFILNNNVAKTKFLEQLIFDGQNVLAEKYFNKCIDVVSNAKEFKDKDKFIAKFYVDRFLNLYRIGRVAESIDLFNITQEKYKASPSDLKYIDYTFGNYRDALLLREEDIVLIDSFEDTKASNIKEIIDAYDGNQDQLSKALAVYNGLQNKLVKRNGVLVDLPSFFIACKNENKKFSDDFSKVCLEKIQNKIAKAKETRNINLLLELVEKYDVITPLPEVRFILMEEYFARGALLKAFSQAIFLFKNDPNLHQQLISKLTFLENISETHSSKRKAFSDKLNESEVNVCGALTTIEKLKEKPSYNYGPKKTIGKFLKEIPLENTHVQYWNHDQINNYQPIEPMFTGKSIYLNGGRNLVNYSISTNEVTWTYHSAFEYQKGTEPGPHQKQFVTTQAGNQVFILTNKDFSEQKTIKSLDLKGNVLWDISERTDSMTEEPVCTPIEGMGKLFCLSQSNNETINSFNLSVFDTHTGKMLNRIVLSNIPGKLLDYNSYPFLNKWNTFTHDQHFVKDNSYIYGYSGTGVLFKVDTNSGSMVWAKGVSKPSFYHNSVMYAEAGFAPSGYIKVFGEVLVSFTPDIQIFTGLNKDTTQQVWKTKYYRPKFIHARENDQAIYYSDFVLNEQISVYKIDPLSGNIIWQTITNGLKITGEGDIIGNKLYIPSEKALVVFDIETGDIIETISIKFQPLKVRCNETHSVVLSSSAAYIFQNDGNLNINTIQVSEPYLSSAKIIEPNLPLAKEISYENINLELTIKVPETIFAGADYWKKTKILKTTKPYHYLMIANEHLTLFREGYLLANGQSVPPSIIWYGQYPFYAISDEMIFVSEYGRIVGSNLFTREKKWSYEYAASNSVLQSARQKVKPFIAVSRQYVAFQTDHESICIVDRSTQKIFLEFNSPRIKSLCIEDNYLIALNESYGDAVCYDINQKGKQIWKQNHNNKAEIYTDNGYFIFVKYSDSSINYFDLKTGALKIMAKPIADLKYTMNKFQLDKNFLFAYNMLYDANSGAPINKFKECFIVAGGGYIGLTKILGNEGFYIDDGKEYSFKSKCSRDHNNTNFSAIRRGNRLTLLTAWWIETFEIVNDKLVLLDAIKFNSGYIGDGQFPGDMQLFPTDNGFCEVIRDEICFFRMSESNINLEKIKSFRVENTKKYEWPFSELYPEIELDDKNWIGYFDSKSKRKMSYLAFADEKSAYLKFKLSPNEKLNLNYILYVSGNGKTNNIALRWDPDYWDKCQISPNLTGNIISWREVDLYGNILLYLKFNLDKVFTRNYKKTLPDFNIELRQYDNEQCEGLYRIGGAYHNGRSFFPWLNYSNEEVGLLSDYDLRSSMYENKINFYPQGEDIALWLNCRRRIFSIDSNIEMLGKMLAMNSKYFCSVNILSALFLEEIQLLRIKQPKLNELSDEYSVEITKVIKRLSIQATQAGVSKEWSDFALSVVTIEVFPFRLDYADDWDSKAIYGLSLQSGKKDVLAFNFSEKNNFLTPYINQPYIEWMIPGLMAGFPRNLNFDTIKLNGIGVEKTGLGKMHFYSPAIDEEFCNRDGLIKNSEIKLKSSDGYNKETDAKLISKAFSSRGFKYNCFTIDQPSVRCVFVPMPNLKSIEPLKNTGQTSDTILAGLEKLTADNNNGPMMMADYLTLSGNMSDEEIKVAYGKFLRSLKSNTRACYHALRDIYQKNINRKESFDFMLDIIKSGKLSPASPRLFFLEYKNIFPDKKSFCFMGPIDKELVNLPEKEFSPTAVYKTEKGTFQFSEVIAQKKGGFIYLASKITVANKEKAYLIAKSAMYSNCSFSIWINGKVVCENIEYVNFGNNFSQNLTIDAGENVLLIKIKGGEEFEWSKGFSLTFGDVFGAPIKGLEIKPANK